MTTMFKKATKNAVYLKLAITGPTGSGKTYSALRLASGLSKKIAFIDTENGSASLYADKFDFSVIDLAPPFTSDKYIKAIQAAVDAGFEVVVIDSLTHAWAGDGGLLNKKESMDAKGGNSFTNWGAITKEDNSFRSSILQSKIHLIGTMRSKMEYVIEQNDKGKSAPRKLGLAPIQRDGIEYEFTTVFDIAMNHEASASKDRTGLYDGKFFQITEKTGEEIKKWLGVMENIEEPKEAPKVEAPKPATNLKETPNDRNMLKKQINDLKADLEWSGADLVAFIDKHFKKTPSELTEKEMIELAVHMNESKTRRDAFVNE